MKLKLFGATVLLLACGAARATNEPVLDPAWRTAAMQPGLPASTVAAPVVLLVEAGSGQTLFQRAADKPFLPASMTKTMTLLVGFDLLAAGKLREDQLIPVRPETAAAWSGKGTSLYLRPGMQISVRDLLLGISTASANDASVVLAEGAAGSLDEWLKLMNARARSLGMINSHFATANGWPDGGKTQVTARDLVRLGQALVREHPALYRAYIGKPALVWDGATFVNHDPFAGVVPGADGIKTGHTREAGYNFLGSVERNGRRLMMVVAGAPTEEARAAAARDLVEWGFAAWISKAVTPGGAVIAQARVQNGTQSSVPLALPVPLSVATSPHGQVSLTSRVIYHGPLQAPVKRGSKVAELELIVNGGPPARFPLIAARSIDQAGALQRIINGLRGMVG